MQDEDSQEGIYNIFLDYAISIPQPHELTVAEVGTELVSIADSKTDPRAVQCAQSGVAVYPNVQIPHDLKPQQQPMLAVFESEPEPDDTQHSQQETTRQLSHPRDKLSMLLRFPVQALKAVRTTVEKASYHIPLLQSFVSVPVPPEISLARRIPDNMTVRATAWHPTVFVLALALQDNGIYFFDVYREAWSKLVLRHDFQREVSCMQYRPFSQNTLAVACKYGVCLWDVGKRVSGFGSGDQAGVCVYLRIAGQKQITSLAWSPDGQKLATACENDHRVAIWMQDQQTGHWKHIFLAVFNGGISRLLWSPAGDYLAAFTVTNVFRVWETETWTSEKWADLSAPIRSAAWSPDGVFLLIAATGESKIHVIKFENAAPVIDGEYDCTLELDEYEYTPPLYGSEDEDEDDADSEPSDSESNQNSATQSLDGSTASGSDSASSTSLKRNRTTANGVAKKKRKSSAGRERLCGVIDELVIDSTGERLAVSFMNSDLIAIIRCDFASLVSRTRFRPVGYIRGPVTNHQAEDEALPAASQLSFFSQPLKQQQVDVRGDSVVGGSLLSLIWRTGKVGFYPLYFAAEAHIKENPELLLRNW